MSLAVNIQGGGLRMTAEADGAVLVRNAGQRDPIADECIQRDQMIIAAGIPDKFLELCNKTLVTFTIVRRIREYDVAVTVERDSILRIRQVFRSQPEVKGVFRHDLERQSGNDLRCARGKHIRVEYIHK